MQSGLEERVTLTSSKIKGDRDRDRLEGDLAGEDGVRDVNVDPSNHTVEIVFDPTITDTNRMRTLVEEAGYSIDSSA